MWPFAKKRTDLDSSFGSVLLKLTVVDNNTLEKAHALQKTLRTSGRHLKLGEILVEMRACTEAQITEALKVQADLRRGGVDAVLRLVERQTERSRDLASDRGAILSLGVAAQHPMRAKA